MLARQADREGRPQLPLAIVERLRTDRDACRDRSIRRLRRPRVRSCPRPRGRRVRVPALERGGPQPAVARVRRGHRARRGAATRDSRRASPRRWAPSRCSRTASSRRSSAGSGRPTTPTSSSITVCAARSPARSLRGTPPRPSARPRSSAAAPAGTPSPRRLPPPAVYVRLHHASDIAAGAALGLALGVAARPFVQ